MAEVKVLKFYPFELPGKKYGIVGYADVEIDGSIVIRMVKLMKNRYGGFYVQMPSLQKGDKNYEIVDIKSRELLEEIRRKVKDEYDRLFGEKDEDIQGGESR